MNKKILAISAVLIIMGASAAYAQNRNFNNQGCPPLEDLTEQEIEGLLFIREEEKLARDVYLTFDEMYSELPIFENIAESEQRHMDVIKNLLDKYGLDDPTEGMDIGEFTNQELQNLYYQLIEEGEQSLNDALTVGGKIEEIDIIDLQNYIEQTDKTDLERVYSNLLKGSKNHLRAFVKELKKQGVTYEPFYLSQEEFDEIINDNNGNGQRWGRIRNWIVNILKKCSSEYRKFRNRR